MHKQWTPHHLAYIRDIVRSQEDINPYQLNWNTAILIDLKSN